ncbi:MAG: Type secretion system protein [Pedosphaera sp.]|nr:Type secretion system protein [Pedosphaera sp.]
MTTFAYSAVDSLGKETKGTLQAADQAEVLHRLKEMGFFPMKVAPMVPQLSPAERVQRHAARLGLQSKSGTRPAPRSFRGRIKAKRLVLFTRQLATLLEAGMPLLRSLRLLEEQETHPPLKRLIAALGLSIESGSTFSEALSQYPRSFNHLYVSMIKAGELGGMLETSLQRLADFMEKAQKIKGKVKAAMFYPAAVVTVAGAVMALLTLFVIPKFKEVFLSLGNGRPLPAFTQFVLGISDAIKSHFLLGLLAAVASYLLLIIGLRTAAGRRAFDYFKLKAPVFGPLFRKLAISRFTRTLGTLVSSGVPILQALTIVKEATGNVIMGRLVGRVHENVKQGESIVGPLRHSGIFPVMVAGMVDVGEQTGALPEMLNKIADNYDEEVDNSVAAMLSLLEPIMIVFLAVVVGSIVIAMFLPILDLTNQGDFNRPGEM